MLINTFNHSDEYVSCTYLTNPDLQAADSSLAPSKDASPGINRTKMVRLYKWYELLLALLQQIGFIGSEFDPCISTRVDGLGIFGPFIRETK